MVKIQKRRAWASSGARFFIGGLCAGIFGGCSPATSGVDNTPPDLSAVSRDMGMDCTDVTGNLLINPGFEVVTGGADPNGKANNTRTPATTIPGPWDGCCTQTGAGGTQWTVSQFRPRCGARSLLLTSTTADPLGNVMYEAFNRTADAGKTFQLIGYVYVDTASSGSLTLDLFDLTTSSVVATSVGLTSPTNGWFQLKFGGSLPSGGNFQVRVKTTGTVTAYIDDLSLALP